MCAGMGWSGLGSVESAGVQPKRLQITGKAGLLLFQLFAPYYKVRKKALTLSTYFQWSGAITLNVNLILNAAICCSNSGSIPNSSCELGIIQKQLITASIESSFDISINPIFAGSSLSINHLM